MALDLAALVTVLPHQALELFQSGRLHIRSHLALYHGQGSGHGIERGFRVLGVLADQGDGLCDLGARCL